jgi:hypothetical protein
VRGRSRPPSTSVMRRARRIALLAAAALCAVAGLAYAGMRTGVLPLAAVRHHRHVPLIRVRLTPASAKLRPGGTARLRIAITGRGWPLTGGVRARTAAVHLAQSPVRLTLRVPRGLRATFIPRTTVTRRSVITLTAATYLRPGVYRLRIVATRVRPRHSHKRPQRAFRTLRLTVLAPPRSTPGTPAGPAAPIPPPIPAPPQSTPGPDTRRLLIGGNLQTTLAPGATRPLDAKVGNPFDEPVAVSAIELTAVRIDAPQATAALPCDASDFTLVPLSGPPIPLPAGVVASLSDLGVPPQRWPAITMLDRPTNQDGCKNAVVTFSYRAVAASLGP